MLRRAVDRSRVVDRSQVKLGGDPVHLGFKESLMLHFSKRRGKVGTGDDALGLLTEESTTVG